MPAHAGEESACYVRSSVPAGCGEEMLECPPPAARPPPDFFPPPDFPPPPESTTTTFFCTSSSCGTVSFAVETVNQCNENEENPCEVPKWRPVT